MLQYPQGLVLSSDSNDIAPITSRCNEDHKRLLLRSRGWLLRLLLWFLPSTFAVGWWFCILGRRLSFPVFSCPVFPIRF